MKFIIFLITFLSIFSITLALSPGCPSPSSHRDCYPKCFSNGECKGGTCCSNSCGSKSCVNKCESS